MRGKNCFVILLLLASAVLFSLGVYKKITRQRKIEKRYVAMVPKGTINMWWEVVHKGAMQAAEEENFVLSWNGPEVESDREKQIQAVEDAIIKGADAIIVGPNDYHALARPIEAISEKKIPCVIMDSMAATEKYDTFVATDNFAGGADAAKIIGAHLNGHGKVLVIQFLQNSASTDERCRGFVETIKKDFPGIEILSAPYTLGTVEDARQKTVDLLMRYPQTDAIFAVNHPASVGAFKGIENQHLADKIKFVAFDSDPILLDGVQHGKVLAIIAQNPFEIGYQSVKQTAKILRGEKVERKFAVPSIIVRQENLEKMKQTYPQALGL